PPLDISACCCFETRSNAAPARCRRLPHLQSATPCGRSTPVIVSNCFSRNRKTVMSAWTSRAALLFAIVIGVGGHAAAQWVQFPTPNVPRLPDGKPNLEPPTPKMPVGHPDLSGVWLPRGRYLG